MTDIVAHHSQLPNKIELTNVGLVIHGDLTWEEAEEAAASLQLAGRTWQWWYGDLLVNCEATFGEEYAQLISEYDENTLRQAQTVAKNVPVELRRAELSFSHHHAVAFLNFAEQKKFLEKAVEYKLSRDDLRKEVSAFKKSLKNGGEPTTQEEQLSARGQDEPEPEPEDETPDWQAELEEAIEINENLSRQLDNLTVDDKDAEIRQLAQENAQLHGRVQEQLARITELEKYEAYVKNELAEIRKLLDVEKTAFVRPAIVALKEQAESVPF